MKLFQSSAVACVITFAALCMLSPSVANAQRRDYMTEAEIELVRDAQDIDQRIDILSKIIDRRFTAAGIDPGGFAVQKKAEDKWGTAPTGSRLELLNDIRFLLQKAIDDIDDVSEHNANAQTQNRTEGLLFPKAVRLLAAAARRYQKILKALADKNTNEKQRGVILASLSMCDEIIEAAAKLPPDKTKTKS
ncbi:MAG: hypothetical protein LC730_01770 [Acidobacteria bacterium]|nr:hypothetical protein [Acidobacteriota bacterium]MCA1608171.1 hypothetical protein [Acidobacteriota bacterium]